MSAATRVSEAATPSPATVEVVRNAFISGAEQMRRNLYRSAHSPVIYEMKDCSVGIYDVQGRLLGQAPGLPFFLGSLGGTLREVIKLKGYEVFRSGDVWIVNDSVICGSHLNDVTVFAPVFVEGTLRGFTAAKAHWNDIGRQGGRFRHRHGGHLPGRVADPAHLHLPGWPARSADRGPDRSELPVSDRAGR